MKNLIKLIILFCLISGISHSQGTYSDSIETNKGKLYILANQSKSYKDGSDWIVFQDEKIFQTMEFSFKLSFYANYYTPDEDIVVVSLGGAASAAFWLILSIDNNRNVWISEKFGNKSDFISIVMKENVLYAEVGSPGYSSKYIYYLKKLIQE